MNEFLLSELTPIFRAVEIHSPTTFSFGGRPVTPQNNSPIPARGANGQSNPLIAQLQQQVYQFCFTQNFTGQLPSDVPMPNAADTLVRELSNANAGRERWEPGWQIHQILPSGQILAFRHGVSRLLWAGEFMTHDGPGVAPRVGANISVYFARESATMQPGFYFAFGETLLDPQDDNSLVRFYWNVRAAGAARLMTALTRELNRFQVPFRFKCGMYRVNYIRQDAAVLYVNRRFFRIAAELVSDVWKQLQNELDAGTPLFTKRLAPGLALAEDPANGESFGMSRSRIVAEGIVNAYAQGSQTEKARYVAVVNAFAAYGIPFERPYLNPGSVDRYHVASLDCGEHP